MSSTLNFDLRQAPPVLFDGARWPVLTMLIVHSNKRNRCWPTMETIAAKVGKALPTVTAAKKWLLDHGAIELVPYDKRVGKEKELPARRHIYQLTGTLTVDDKPLSYLYDNEADNGESTSEYDDDVSEIEISKSEGLTNNDSKTEISETKISIDKTLTSSSSKSKSRKRKKSNTSAASQQSTPASTPVGQDVPKLPEPPKGKAWFSSSDYGTEYAHLAKTTSKLGCLCKASIRHRNKYSAALGPRKPCPDCLKAAEPKPKVAQEPQPWSALTKAMHEATPEDIRPVSCFYAKHDKSAHALFDAGFTPERIKAFVEATYPTYRDWAKMHDKPMLMSMNHVEQYIKAWEATKGKQVAPIQVADLPGASDEETAAYLERLSTANGSRSIEDNHWLSARSQLQVQLKPATFNGFVQRLRLVTLDKGPPAVYTFEATNDTQKDWIMRHLVHSLTETLAQLRRCEVRVEIRVAAAKAS